MSAFTVAFSDLAPRDRYKLLCASVTPRPIALVTSLSPDGVVNAAPFSFFNVFSEDPALIVQARKRVAAAKDAWSAVAGGELHRRVGHGQRPHERRAHRGRQRPADEHQQLPRATDPQPHHRAAKPPGLRQRR